MPTATPSTLYRVLLLWGLSIIVLAALLLVFVIRQGNSSYGRQSAMNTQDRPAWLQPLGEQAASKHQSQRVADASHLPPGEPGVLDVQAWDWLNQDLERLVDQTRLQAYQRLSPEAFQDKFLGATSAFLELSDAATHDFESAVSQALREIDNARENMLQQQTHAAPAIDEASAIDRRRTAWADFAEAQRHAERYPLAVLDVRPRHQLLREDMLTWLLRLDYGRRASSR